MNVLQSLSQRNGQWYYLSSMANMGLGNNVNALNDIKQAIRLEPDNVQYQMVLQQMEGGGNWYQEMQNPFGGMPTGGDDYCMKLCLANMAYFAAKTLFVHSVLSNVVKIHSRLPAAMEFW